MTTQGLNPIIVIRLDRYREFLWFAVNINVNFYDTVKYLDGESWSFLLMGKFKITQLQGIPHLRLQSDKLCEHVIQPLLLCR